MKRKEQPAMQAIGSHTGGVHNRTPFPVLACPPDPKKLRPSAPACTSAAQQNLRSAPVMYRLPSSQKEFIARVLHVTIRTAVSSYERKKEKRIFTVLRQPNSCVFNALYSQSPVMNTVLLSIDIIVHKTATNCMHQTTIKLNIPY